MRAELWRCSVVDHCCGSRSRGLEYVSRDAANASTDTEMLHSHPSFPSRLCGPVQDEYPTVMWTVSVVKRHRVNSGSRYLLFRI